MVRVGRSGVCWWAVVTGQISDAGFETFRAHLREIAHSPVHGRVVLDFIFDAPMPNATQRRALVETLQGAEHLDRCAGHALVVNSKMGRALLTTINWFVPPAFNERVFSTPDEGASWLNAQNPKFDASSTLADIAAECPEFRRLRW